MMPFKMEISRSAQQLAASLHGAGCDILIEASAGSGTSEFLHTICNLEPGLEVIEFREDRDESAVQALVTHLEEQDRAASVVVCRRAPEQIRSALGRHVGLRETDLWHTTNDVAEVLGREVLSEAVAEVARFTSGWPAAVQALAALAVDLNAIELDAIADQPARIGVDGEPWLHQLDPDQAWAVGVLCRMGRFDATSVEHLDATDALATAIGNGLPVCQNHAGWSTLPPVALSALLIALANAGPANEPTLSATDATREKRLIECMLHLEHNGELEQCIDFCLAIGRNDLAAFVLSRSPRDVCERADANALRTHLITLESDFETNPKLALAAVAVGHRLGDPGLIRRALDAAMSGIDRNDPTLSSADSQEVAAEAAFRFSVLGDNHATEALVARLTASGVETVSAAGARLLEAQVGLQLLEMSPTSLETARAAMTSAISVWRQLGRQTDAAESTRRLAGAIMRNLGLTRDAVQLIERALGDRLPGREIAVLQLARGQFLAELGELDSAKKALELAATVAADATGPQLAAQAAEGLADLASLAGDADEVAAQYEQLSAAIGPWRQTRLGGHLLGQMAVSFARVARSEIARSLIDECARIEHADPREVALYDALVTAYLDPGDHAVAQAEAIAESLPMPPVGRWTMLFMQSLAHRATRPDKARQLLAEASQSAIETSGIDKPRVVEHLHFASIMGQTNGEPPCPATSPPASPQIGWRVCVLGGFSIKSDGSDSPVVTGHQATLIKLLVLSQGYCTIDRAVDAIWPEIDLPTGRRRLRNILSRIRSSVGEMVFRDDQLLRLAPAVSSDIAELRADIADVLAAPTPGHDAVASAHARLTVELLPMNRFDQWLEPFDAEFRDLRNRFIERFSNARADEPELPPLLTHR